MLVRWISGVELDLDGDILAVCLKLGLIIPVRSKPENAALQTTTKRPIKKEIRGD